MLNEIRKKLSKCNKLIEYFDRGLITDQEMNRLIREILK